MAMKIINGVYRYILRKHSFIKYPLNQDSSACLCGAWIALMYLLYLTKVQFSIKCSNESFVIVPSFTRKIISRHHQ